MWKRASGVDVRPRRRASRSFHQQRQVMSDLIVRPLITVMLLFASDYGQRAVK
jgi:hypothetical protein